MKKIINTIFAIFFFYAFANAQIVNIPDAEFKAVLLAAGVDLNMDGEIQTSEAIMVTDIEGSGSPIESLEGIKEFANLETLYCSACVLTELDVNGLQFLKTISLDNNVMESVTLSNLPSLEYFEASHNAIQTVSIVNLPLLSELQLMQNSISNAELINLPSLRLLDLSFNDLIEIELNQLTGLEDLMIMNNQLNSLNVMNLSNLQFLNCMDNQLKTLFIKSANDGLVVDLIINDQLEYICCHENLVEYYQQELEILNIPNCIVNSFCSFTNGGEVFESSFKGRIDLNANGCDQNDNSIALLKFEVSDGVSVGCYSADDQGEFNFFLAQGSYTIKPIVDGNKFTIQPNELTLDFPDAQNSMNEFCLTPNQDFTDLDVSIIPIDDPRPGFLTDYKLLVRNKGTLPFTGQLSLTYIETLMDFISAEPSESEVQTNKVIWTVDNIQPFEVKNYFFTMELNAPTDDPPLNDGDYIWFESFVDIASTDDTPQDNADRIVQTVINSFDPNDKACLEGEYMSIDDVGDFLAYKIRFENTGSAEAVNIVIVDSIDLESLDFNSIEIVEASHPVFLRIKEPNVAEFVFENIYLPFDDANNDGYVLFRIRTLETLVLGDQIKNDAEIYFDFNAPIVTNETITIVTIDADEDGFVQELDCDDINPDINPIATEIPNNGIDEDCDGVDLTTSIEDITVFDIQFFPNPTSEQLTIFVKEECTLEFFSLSGQVDRRIKLAAGKNKMEMADLKSGLYLARFISEGEVLTIQKITIE